MKKLNLNVNGKQKQYELKDNSTGIKLEEISKDIYNDYKGFITLAIVDRKIRELNYEVEEECDIKFLDTNNPDGLRVYFRGISLIFIMACKELFNECDVVIEHSLSGGLYCEVHGERTLNEEDIDNIKKRMVEIVENDYTIEKIETTRQKAIELFEQEGRYEKAELLKYKEYDDTKVYKCNDYIDHFYGYMVPSTGYIKTFDLKLYNKGVVVLGPSKEDKNVPRKFMPDEKLANIYYEAEQWSKLMGVDKVLSLNKIIENKKYGDMIRTVEALQEKKISQIADMINERKSKLILIAAPSSSGKTSFAHKLCIHLRVNHLNPISISLDDYFVDREHTPKDEFGKYDFESIYAIDLDKFNKDLTSLFNGDEIDIIKFNFKTGKREYTGEKLKIEKNQPVILEGIHGLNPILTSSIPDKDKFKIYISALTQINLDNHNRIPTTDLRLIRRMVRDSNFRGYDAEKTIMQWPSVRRGEDKNIFPYQGQADVIFNSACVYEIAVLKKYATALLEDIGIDSPAYIEANRLLKFLQYFVELEDTSDIPYTSIIREFIGGSKIVE